MGRYGEIWDGSGWWLWLVLALALLAWKPIIRVCALLGLTPPYVLQSVIPTMSWALPFSIFLLAFFLGDQSDISLIPSVLVAGFFGFFLKIKRPESLEEVAQHMGVKLEARSEILQSGLESLVSPSVQSNSPLAVAGEVNAPDEPSEFRLGFWLIGGVGVIHCRDCKFQQALVGSTHGDGATLGYQCQQCSSFVTVDYPEFSPQTPPNCECGGVLSRDFDVRCPRCLGYHVRYEMEYIT